MITSDTPRRKRRAPAPRVAIPAELSKAEFETLTGYSAKQVTRFVQETDIPHRRAENELFFPWPAARAWVHRYLEDKGKRRASPTDAKDARKRQEIAQAELAELDVAKARNELMTVAQHEKLLGEAFARVRARLANLPPRAAGVVLGATTIQDAQARIQPVVDEIFAELRKTDDVPDTYDEEDHERDAAA